MGYSFLFPVRIYIPVEHRCFYSFILSWEKAGRDFKRGLLVSFIPSQCYMPKVSSNYTAVWGKYFSMGIIMSLFILTSFFLLSLLAHIFLYSFLMPCITWLSRTLLCGLIYILTKNVKFWRPTCPLKHRMEFPWFPSAGCYTSGGN